MSSLINPEAPVIDFANGNQMHDASATPPPGLAAPETIEAQDAALVAAVGIVRTPNARSGTYIQRDFYPLCLVAWHQGVELLPIAAALERYAWLRENYYWRAVSREQDEVTALCAAEVTPQGFFLRIRQGVKVPLPVEACLYMTHGDMVQMVHNVIILEEDAELKLITGCTIRHGALGSAHFGITESYVGPHATLTSTMVHSWEPETVVRPRTGTVVAQGGKYMDTYCSLQPVKSIQSEPRTWLVGADASAKYLTIVLGVAGSTIDTGGEVYLNGDNARAELMHRAICTGGQIYQRGLLVGNARCRAHIDCAGMVLDTIGAGFIQSIPGLKSSHPEARMSHEASIGKFAPEQVEYLQTRGLDEHAAISLIIRGFLGVDTVELGAQLDARIAEIAELAGHGEE
ncbi:MAG: SufD family Fe-S cluster assembly protein [Caldilinea sp.]